MSEPENGPGWVESEAPKLPELTGEPELDAQIQLALTADDIVRIKEASFHSFAQTIATLNDISNKLGGGLSPEAKRKWLMSGFEEGQSLDNLWSDAEDFLDSPAT